VNQATAARLKEWKLAETLFGRRHDAALLAQQPSDSYGVAGESAGPRDLEGQAPAQLRLRADRRRQYFKYLQSVKHPTGRGKKLALCAEIAAFPQRESTRSGAPVHRPPASGTQGLRGKEIGTWAGASQFARAVFFDLIAAELIEDWNHGHVPGRYPENATYRYQGEESAGSSKLGRLIAYRVPFQSSHYRFKSGPGWTATAFNGVFWVDPDSLEIRRLVLDANEMPPETGAAKRSPPSTTRR